MSVSGVDSKLASHKNIKYTLEVIFLCSILVDELEN